MAEQRPPRPSALVVDDAAPTGEKSASAPAAARGPALVVDDDAPDTNPSLAPFSSVKRSALVIDEGPPSLPATVSAIGRATGAQGGARNVAPRSALPVTDVFDSLTEDRSFLRALFYESRSEAELLRSPPSEDVFRRRLEDVERLVSEIVGRSDFSLVDRAVAQAGAERLREGKARTGSYALALGELRERQRGALTRELPTLKHPAHNRLYAVDIVRLEARGADLGLAREESRAVARAWNLEIVDAEAMEWKALESLESKPKSLTGLTAALLDEPTTALVLLASEDETIRKWLVSNAVSPDGSEARSVENAQREARQGARSLYLVHKLAWDLYRLEIVVGGQRYGQPERLRDDVMGDRLRWASVRDCATEGVLGPWLDRMGLPVAARMAREYAAAPDNPKARRQLELALGWPFTLGAPGGVVWSWNDVVSFARDAQRERALRTLAVDAYVDGTLRTWLECLPASATDVVWLDDLRRVAGHEARDALAFWRGVYRHAPSTVLTVQKDTGERFELVEPQQLTGTRMLTSWWDALKPIFYSGELSAWLEYVGDDQVRRAVAESPRPVSDRDRELNELLWRLGHRGVVLEAGAVDRGFTAPEDVVTFYENEPGAWAAIEEQLPRRYLLEWLKVFCGSRSSHPHGARIERSVEFVYSSMRGAAPSGYLALGVALACGMRALPLRPDAPGLGRYVALERDDDPTAWEPLETHVAQGTAVLWALQQPSAPEAALFALLERLARRQTDVATATRELSSLVGAPVPAPGWVPPPRRAAGPQVPSNRPAPLVSTPPSAPVVTESRLTSIAAPLLVIGALATLITGVSLRRCSPPVPPDDGGITRRLDTPLPPAEQPRSCQITSTNPVPFGNYVDGNTGIRIATNGSEVAVGWRVARTRRHGTDDYAVARVGIDGSLVGWLDREDPTHDNNREWSPLTVQRVQPCYEGGELRALTAEVLRTADSQTMRCGEFSSTWHVDRNDEDPTADLTAPNDPPDQTPVFAPTPSGLPAQLALPADITAAYYCRGLASTSPFVLAAHANLSPDGTLSPAFSLLATRNAPNAEARPLIDIEAPRTIQAASSSAHPMEELVKGASPSSAVAADLPGRGYALAFRYGHTMYWAWLDRDLNLVAGVERFSLESTTYDHQLAASGDAAVLVYSEHGTVRESHSPLRVFARSARFGASLGGPVRLDTTEGFTGSETNPSAAALPDGWLVSWTQRTPASGNPASWTRVVRSYTADLRPEGAATTAMANGSDGLVVTSGSRFVIAVVLGQGRSVPVAAVAGRCDLR